jgi:hypothetical protein
MGTRSMQGISDKGDTLWVADGPSAMQVMFNLFHPETRKQQYVHLLTKEGHGFEVEIDGFELEPLPGGRTSDSGFRYRNRSLLGCRMKGVLLGHDDRPFTVKYDLHDRSGPMRIQSITAKG